MRPATLRFQMIEVPMLRALRPYTRQKLIRDVDYIVALTLANEADRQGRTSAKLGYIEEELGLNRDKLFKSMKRLRSLDLLRKGNDRREGAFYMVNPDFIYAGARAKQDEAVELFGSLEMLPGAVQVKGIGRKKTIGLNWGEPQEPSEALQGALAPA